MQVTHTNPSTYCYKSSLPVVANDPASAKEKSLLSAEELVQERSEFSSESRTKIVSENGIQLSEVSVKHTYERSLIYSSSTTVHKDKENSLVNTDVAVDAVGNHSNNEAASTILTFIGNRIEKDLAEGASLEEVESRLQAGLEGFIKGFTEASEQLEALGLLDGEDNPLKDNINGTYDSVLSGIENLREKFLDKNVIAPNKVVVDEIKEVATDNSSIKSHIPLDNVSSNDAALINNFSKLTSHHRFENVSSRKLENDASVLNSFAKTPSLSGSEFSTFHHQQGVKNSFSFQVETVDGDKVTITAKTNDVSVTKYSLFNTPMWENEKLARVNDQDSLFSVSVDGDLDDDELNAIGNLLNKVENLSANFFEGDLDLAFSQASNLGYDTSEIVGFSLNLKHVEIEKVRAAYQEFLPTNNEQNKQVESLLDKLKPIGDFTKDLIDAAQVASKFSESHSLIVELASKFDVQKSDENAFSHRFSSFIAQLLEDGVNV